MKEDRAEACDIRCQNPAQAPLEVHGLSFSEEQHEITEEMLNQEIFRLQEPKGEEKTAYSTERSFMEEGLDDNFLPIDQLSLIIFEFQTMCKDLQGNKSSCNGASFIFIPLSVDTFLELR